MCFYVFWPIFLTTFLLMLLPRSFFIFSAFFLNLVASLHLCILQAKLSLILSFSLWLSHLTCMELSKDWSKCLMLFSDVWAVSFWAMKPRMNFWQIVAAFLNLWYWYCLNLYLAKTILANDYIKIADFLALSRILTYLIR